MNQRRQYLLLDASAVVPYYLKRADLSGKVHGRVKAIVDSMKVLGRAPKPFILYIPNFCVAEVFNTLRKFRYGKWNRQVKKHGGCISESDYSRAYGQFQRDVHNGKLFYHYELSRYHLLNTSLISPIDHHYAFQRSHPGKKKNPAPMSTFDQLVVAMGIELVKMHGRDRVLILTCDARIVNILHRAENIGSPTARKLGLDRAARFVGRSGHSRTLYPRALDLSRATDSRVASLVFPFAS